MTYIRTARPRDIRPVGARMRVRDIEEVRAAAGLDPCEALWQSFEASKQCWTICAPDHTPFAMFGVAPLAPGAGAPWMLATDEFARHTLFILRNTRRYLEAMHEEFPVLTNFVDWRNRDSLTYLRAVGFEFTAFDPEFGVARVPFIQFTRVRHV